MQEKRRFLCETGKKEMVGNHCRRAWSEVSSLSFGLSRIAHNTARSLIAIPGKAPKEPMIVLNKYSPEAEQGELL